jgi:hypothetical protein
MTFAGLLMAALAALIGIAFGAGDTSTVRVGSVVVAIGLLGATALAFWSAKPTQWEYVGNEPGQWLEDIESQDQLHDGMAAMAEFYDEMIKANEAAIASAAWKMTASMAVAFAFLTVGVLGAVLA